MVLTPHSGGLESKDFVKIVFKVIEKYLQNKRTTAGVQSWYFKNKGECILLFFCNEKMNFKTCIGEADFLQLKNRI